MHKIILKTVLLLTLIGCQIMSLSSAEKQQNIFHDETMVACIIDNLSTPVVDGDLGDEVWQKTVPLSGFYLVDGINFAQKQTEVKIAYDEQNLYFLIKCLDTKSMWTKANVVTRDGRVWDDDCIEIYISPQAEFTYHIIINSTNTVFDEKNSVVESARGYESDPKHNLNIITATRVYDDCWTVELAVPFTEIGGFKDKYGINICREERELLEHSSWSPIEGKFYQPDKFGELNLKTNTVTRRNAVWLDREPYKIVRDKELFATLLSTEPGNYRVNLWNHALIMKSLPKYLQEKLKDREELKKYTTEYLDLLRAAEIMMPRSGESVTEYRIKHNLETIVFLESSATDNTAIKNGAEISFPNQEKKRASIIDPIYVKTTVDEVKTCVTKCKDDIGVIGFRGQDEPLVKPPAKDVFEKSKFWQSSAVEIFENYGFKKYKIPITDSDDYKSNLQTRPFQWIAFNRWGSNKYYQTKKEVYTALKSIEPRFIYQPCDYWFMGGFSPFGFSLMSDVGDEFVCDPYTTSADKKHNRTPGRGLYNHGFGTKFLSDMTDKPVWTIAQSFFYDGYKPTAEDMREWCSQAIKNGAQTIEYYASDVPYITDKPRWEMMLHVAKVFTGMNRLNLPTTTKTAIFYSEQTHFSDGLACYADELYTAYSLLGEKTGCWFKFVSDEQIKNNKVKLSNYKIVYLPWAEYQSEDIVRQFDEYVLNGGILVGGDPSAFSYDINGDKLDYYQEKLFGIKIDDKDESANIIIEDNTLFPNIKKGSNLKTFNPQHRERGFVNTARKIKIIDTSAKILGKLSSDNPGIIYRQYGKGQVIYFAANPFSPQVLKEEPKWAELMKDIQKLVGEPTDLPIWKFKIPLLKT